MLTLTAVAALLLLLKSIFKSEIDLLSSEVSINYHKNIMVLRPHGTESRVGQKRFSP